MKNFRKPSMISGELTSRFRACRRTIKLQRPGRSMNDAGIEEARRLFRKTRAYVALSRRERSRVEEITKRNLFVPTIETKAGGLPRRVRPAGSSGESSSNAARADPRDTAILIAAENSIADLLFSCRVHRAMCCRPPQTATSIVLKHPSRERVSTTTTSLK